jgi:hypothetical protein
MALRITLPLAMSVLLSTPCEAQAPSEAEYRAELTQSAKKAADILLGNIEQAHAANNTGGGGPCPPRTPQVPGNDYYCVKWTYKSGLGDLSSGARNNNLQGAPSSAAANAGVAQVTKDFDDLKASVVAPWVDPLVQTWKEQQQLRQDITGQIGQILTPELRQQIVDDAAKKAIDRVLAKLQEEGVIGPNARQ